MFSYTLRKKLEQRDEKVFEWLKGRRLKDGVSWNRIMSEMKHCRRQAKYRFLEMSSNEFKQCFWRFWVKGKVKVHGWRKAGYDNAIFPDPKNIEFIKEG